MDMVIINNMPAALQVLCEIGEYDKQDQAFDEEKWDFAERAAYTFLFQLAKALESEEFVYMPVTDDAVTTVLHLPKAGEPGTDTPPPPGAGKPKEVAAAASATRPKGAKAQKVKFLSELIYSGILTLLETYPDYFESIDYFCNNFKINTALLDADEMQSLDPENPLLNMTVATAASEYPHVSIPNFLDFDPVGTFLHFEDTIEILNLGMQEAAETFNQAFADRFLYPPADELAKTGTASHDPQR